MNFLDMKTDLKPQNYEWHRGVSGRWRHWQKRVLGGKIFLHVVGSKDAGGYWGNICTRIDNDVVDGIIHRTMPAKGLHIPFKTPENCALHLDEKWKSILNNEIKLL